MTLNLPLTHPLQVLFIRFCTCFGSLICTAFRFLTPARLYRDYQYSILYHHRIHVQWEINFNKHNEYNEQCVTWQIQDQSWYFLPQMLLNGYVKEYMTNNTHQTCKRTYPLFKNTIFSGILQKFLICSFLMLVFIVTFKYTLKLNLKLLKWNIRMMYFLLDMY